ncbi:MAG: hypothetical protein RBT41_05360, partial [Clostridia bacterium]|nr:hypothetical protein [Clostridia bacterium]
NLLIKNTARISLVYVTALAGGERILAASALEEEENTFAGITDLALPPSGYLCVKRNIKIQLVDMSRIICKYDHIWSVFLDDPALKTPAAHAEIQPETAPLKQPPLTVIRKKPGEKWLKKAGSVQLKTALAKLVITVRK